MLILGFVLAFPAYHEETKAVERFQQCHCGQQICQSFQRVHAPDEQGDLPGIEAACLSCRLRADGMKQRSIDSAWNHRHSRRSRTVLCDQFPFLSLC